MAASLTEYTKEEQQSVIRFLWSVGVKTSDMYRRMTVQYGDNCMSGRKVYKRVEKVKAGHRNVAA
jgi:predicted RNA-binding protein with PIN domain